MVVHNDRILLVTEVSIPRFAYGQSSVKSDNEASTKRLQVCNSVILSYLPYHQDLIPGLSWVMQYTPNKSVFKTGKSSDMPHEVGGFFDKNNKKQ